jgi:hypothetical protein
MPEAMSSTGETDTFAAEFVLGTLDADERRAAHALLASDDSFAERVHLWERRLGELHLMVEPVEPVTDVWPRIKARMPEVQQVTAAASPEPDLEAPAELERATEPLPDQQAEAALESPVGWEAETEAQAESEPEPKTERKELAPSAVHGSAFESLLEALEKPFDLEPPPKSEIAEPETPPLPETEIADSETTLPEPSPASAAAPPAPSWHLPPHASEEPVEEAPVAPAPPFVAPLPLPPTEAVPSETPRLRKAERSLSRWRVFTALLLLLLAASAGLVAAWRFVPERIPPALQPVALMRLAGIPVPASSPPRRPPPPESSFQE